MVSGLKKYFPMIQTKGAILQEIQQKQQLNSLFNSWTKTQQKEFLDFTSGMKGVKILYNAFFKEIFDPEAKPERLEMLLSLLLNQKVKVKKALPTDNTRIADESSLLIMDILVELEDGELANIECQKIGYKFPGQRSACYSADLLLRQYKRVRDIKGDMFSYKDVKRVYTIVLFETSTGDFHAFPNDYIHYAKQETNTGVHIDLLQEYIRCEMTPSSISGEQHICISGGSHSTSDMPPADGRRTKVYFVSIADLCAAARTPVAFLNFIPLDIFRKNLYNRGITNQLDAWLTFLSVDDLKWIVKLIQSHPEFKPLYNEVYAICRNTEQIMGIFSEELKILDKNTVQLMIDEMQDEIDSQKNTINSQKNEIDSQKDTIDSQKMLLDQKEAEIARLQKLLKNQKRL